MMNAKLVFRIGAAAGVGMLALAVACQQDTTPTSPQALQLERASSQPSGLPVREGEAHFKELSDAVPEFGGWFIEEGRVVAIVTDLAKGPAIRSALSATVSEVRQQRMPVVAADVEVRKGEYTFEQLRDWRDQILQAWPKGMTYLDLDESDNRVAVGVLNGPARGVVESFLARADIPVEAVAISLRGYPKLDVGAAGSAVAMRQGIDGTLRDTLPGLISGIRITLDREIANDPPVLSDTSQSGPRLVTQ